MPSAIAVAHSFLGFARRDEEKLGIVRLHKLVYFAHGWFLGFEDGKPLVDEALEAWAWGPVFPSLYYRLAGHAGEDISRVMDGSPVVPGGETRDFIEMIWSVYRPLRTIQLSAMAHQKGSPWYKTVTEALGKEDTSVDFLLEALPVGLVIPRGTMQEYFEGMVRRERDRASQEAAQRGV